MSKRIQVQKALMEKMKAIDGSAYPSNIYSNAYAKLKFWDEVNDFPCIYSSPGNEQREYLPGNFKWAFLTITLKLYCKGEDSSEQLEQLLEDVEAVIDANRVLVYDTTNNYSTTDMSIVSIITDEGLLAPYAVGEIILQVQYALP